MILLVYVGANSIECSQCKLWVHKKCSGIKGGLSSNLDYVCPRCRDQARPIDGRPVSQVEVDGSLLDVEASFCYLGDMLCAGGGCELAIITRCCTAWGKFKKLLPILTSKHVSLLTRGKLFEACVRAAMLHGRCEAWAPSSSDLQRLRRNDRAMVRWICGVKPDDGVDTDVLYGKLGIHEVTASLRARRLRWYGHVERATSCTNSITKLPIPGTRGRGRPRKSWSDCVRDDLEACSLGGTDPQNRGAWRAGVRRSSRLLSTPATGTPRSRWQITSGSSQVKSMHSTYL